MAQAEPPNGTAACRKSAPPGKATAELAPNEEVPLAPAARALDILSELARHGYSKTEPSVLVPKADTGRPVRRGGHSRGRRIVYLSDHPASALLEVLLHLEVDPQDLPASYHLLAVDIR